MASPPVNSKIQGISERLRPNILKELRSFLGAVNQLNKVVPIESIIPLMESLKIP